MGFCMKYPIFKVNFLNTNLMKPFFILIAILFVGTLSQACAGSKIDQQVTLHEEPPLSQTRSVQDTLKNTNRP